MILFIFICIFLVSLSKNQTINPIEYCEDCQLGCCHYSLVCANDVSYCSCIPTYCRNGCCVNGRCGTNSDCSTSSLLLLSIGIVCALSLSFSCLLTLIRMCRQRKKIINSLAIINLEHFPIISSNNLRMNRLNMINDASGTRSNKENVIRPAIDCVVIGNPVDFPINQTTNPSINYPARDINKENLKLDLDNRMVKISLENSEPKKV